MYWMIFNQATSFLILGSLFWFEYSVSSYLDNETEENVVLVEASGGLLLSLLAVSLPRLLVIKLPEDNNEYEDELDCM